MNNVIIETIVSVISNLAITLIAVLGAWLMAQIGKSQKLDTVNKAVGELTAAAETTVLELQQTIVEGLKNASADGTLTPDDVEKLGQLLLKGALEKMSDSAMGVLRVANVDINAIVTGAGEALIARIKRADSLLGDSVGTHDHL